MRTKGKVILFASGTAGPILGIGILGGFQLGALMLGILIAVFFVVFYGVAKLPKRTKSGLWHGGESTRITRNEEIDYGEDDVSGEYEEGPPGYDSLRDYNEHIRSDLREMDEDVRRDSDEFKQKWQQNEKDFRKFNQKTKRDFDSLGDPFGKKRRKR